MSADAPELAPIPEGWEAHRAKDGIKFVHACGLYVDVVIVEVFAVEPAWTDGPEELAALCAMLCWLRDAWEAVTRHYVYGTLHEARTRLTELCGLVGAT